MDLKSLLLLMILHGFLRGIWYSRGSEVSRRKLADDSYCPLNFNEFAKILSNNPVALQFTDVSTECHSLLQAVRIIRSDFLRNTGYFTFPVSASEPCWMEYQSLVNDYIESFDVRSVCGVQTPWISNACMNISTRSQFVAVVPENQLQELIKSCNQSLNDDSSCAPCLAAVSSIQSAYFRGSDSESSNISDCLGFPSIYAAAFGNQYGPTNLGTIKCLFSIDYSTLVRSKANRHEVLLPAVLIGSVVGLLLVTPIVWFLWTQQRKKCGKFNIRKEDEDDKTSDFKLHSGCITFVRFNIEELKRATRNFSRENLVGTGRFGNVYKGILEDGSEVAVKRFKNCSVAHDTSFGHEVEVIASVRHVNLVALKGYCTATLPVVGHQRIIVCDFIRNGSLYDHLFSSGAEMLSWPIRKMIALGIARGLAYLHNGIQPAIIHRDIKASNILLDESFEPKLADFGLAKFTPDGFSHFSTKIAGTLGYVSPECALYGQVTEKSDVYSYGVVLLELLSGKKAVISIGKDHQAVLLTDWAWSLVREGRALEIIDEKLTELGDSEVMEKHILVAILSVHPLLHARPTMNQIVTMLESDTMTVASKTDALFLNVAEIDEIQRLVSFTGGTTMLNFAD